MITTITLKRNRVFVVLLKTGKTGSIKPYDLVNL